MDADTDAGLVSDVMHLSQRLIQALAAEIEHQQTDADAKRLGALAELEAVRDEIDAVLDEHREGEP